MSKTFLDADLDAEIEEMEKEEDNSEGEEENEGIDIEKSAWADLNSLNLRLIQQVFVFLFVLCFYDL